MVGATLDPFHQAQVAQVQAGRDRRRGREMARSAAVRPDLGLRTAALEPVAVSTAAAAGTAAAAAAAVAGVAGQVGRATATASVAGAMCEGHKRAGSSLQVELRPKADEGTSVDAADAEDADTSALEELQRRRRGKEDARVQSLDRRRTVGKRADIG